MDNSLKIECNLDKLKDVRAFVDNALISYGVQEEQRSMLVLAVDEICANVIIHSHGRDSSKNLEVKIFPVNNGVRFEIHNSGKPFDPSTVSEPDINTIINEKRKGGVGLMLVRRIMDSFDVYTENDLTVYSLFKKV